MCAPEGYSEFCFPESLNVKKNVKNSLFSEGAHIKCFVIYQGKKNQQHLYDDCISRYHDNKSKIL